MNKKVLKSLKKGFTLIEMSIVILATSILLIGFTAFTIFFSQQYQYEQKLMNGPGSATYLKYAISNNIDRYNYTFDKGYDFKLAGDGKVNNSEMFSILSLEANSSGYYVSATIKNYKFIENTEEGKSYFGYLETIYELPGSASEDFNSSYYESGEKNRTHIIDIINRNNFPKTETDCIVYQTESYMRLAISRVDESSLATNQIKLRFTIDYNFEDVISPAGKDKLVFDKYIYYI